MQWPPTRPGLNGKKFHLLPAASRTSWVSMSIRLNRTESSFINAMFRSRWVFSMTLAASATRIELVLCTPAVTTAPYTSATVSRVAASEPDTIFLTLVNVCSRSPGLMRSGLYPTVKSTPNFSPEQASSTGTQSSSVAPG